MLSETHILLVVLAIVLLAFLFIYYVINHLTTMHRDERVDWRKCHERDSERLNRNLEDLTGAVRDLNVRDMLRAARSSPTTTQTFDFRQSSVAGDAGQVHKGVEGA